MRPGRYLALLLAALAFAAGCGGDGESGEDTATEEGGQAEIANAAFERGYSECSTLSLQALAAKYGVEKDVEAVTTAVGIAWANRFNGGLEAQSAGKDGCAQALAEPR